MTQTFGIVRRFPEAQVPITHELPEADDLLQVADIITSAHGELSALVNRYPSESNWDTDAVWTHEWLAENSEDIQTRLEAKLAGQEFSLGEIEGQVTALEDAIYTTRLLAYAPSQRRERATTPINLIPEQVSLQRARFEFIRSVYRVTAEGNEPRDTSPMAEWDAIHGAAYREGVDPSRMELSPEHQAQIHQAYWGYRNMPELYYQPSNKLFEDWAKTAHPEMSAEAAAAKYVALSGEWLASPEYAKQVSQPRDKARKEIIKLGHAFGFNPVNDGDFFNDKPWVQSAAASVSKEIETLLAALDGPKDAEDRKLIELDGAITELERQTMKAYRLSNLPEAIRSARIADINDKLQDIVASLLLQRTQAVDLGEDTSDIDALLDRFSRTGAFVPYIVQPNGTEPSPVEVAQAYIDSLQGALTSKHLSRIAASALATAA